MHLTPKLPAGRALHFSEISREKKFILLWGFDIPTCVCMGVYIRHGGHTISDWGVNSINIVLL